MATENLPAAGVAPDALSREVTTGRRRGNPMEAVLITLRAVVDDFLVASYFCRSVSPSAVDCRLGTFTSTLCEAFRANVTSLRGNKDRYIDRAITTVHKQLLHHCDSFNAGRALTHLPSVRDPRIRIGWC